VDQDKACVNSTAVVLEKNHVVRVDSSGVQRVASIQLSLQELAAEEPELFWTKLVETDDRHTNFKITELIVLIRNVNEMKLFYTFVSCLARIGKLEHEFHAKYLYDALVVTSKTTTTVDDVAHFKLILQKAKEDRHLDPFNVHKLDREAEIVNTSHAPFVQDIREYLRCLEGRVSNVEGRLDNAH
jgi:hypothetical protein